MKCNVVSMSDISSLVSTLDQKRQELARIEIELKQAQRQRLETLAGDMGFQNTDELSSGLPPLHRPLSRRRFERAIARESFGRRQALRTRFLERESRGLLLAMKRARN